MTTSTEEIRYQVEQKPSRRWLWWLFSLVVLLLMGATAVLLILTWFYSSNLIMPGTTTWGVDLGGMTFEDATETLDAHWQQRIILLDGDDFTWTVTPAQLGITFDAVQTARQAYDYSRMPDHWQRVVLDGGQTFVPPVWQIDMAVAERNLRSQATQFDVSPTNANVQVIDGRVETAAAQDGYVLDIDTTLAYLSENAAQVVTDSRLPLTMHTVSPEITDVNALANEVRQLLTTAVAIQAFDPIRNEQLDYTITPDLWQNWLTLQVDSAAEQPFIWQVNSQQAQLSLEREMDSWLGDGRYLETEGLSDAVVTAVQNGLSNPNPTIKQRIYHEPTQHIVQRGETFASIGRDYGMPYPWLQQVNPNISDLYPGQAIIIPSPDDLIPLPVVENKRVIVSISEQKMWAYENGQLKWEWLASTGIDDSPTSPGVFQVQTHETNAYAGNWDLWMPYFMGIYQPIPTSSFMNGFHGFPTRDGHNILWTSSLGRQVTYGCILVSTENSELLFNWAEAGVIVEIRP